MRLAISLFAVLLFVTGCPGMAGNNSGQGSGDGLAQGDLPQDDAGPDGSAEPGDGADPDGADAVDADPGETDPGETDPGDDSEPGGPDDNDDLSDLTDEVPPGAEFYVAWISGPPDDWTVLTSSGTDSVNVTSFAVDSGVYTIELDVLSSEAGSVEAKGTAFDPEFDPEFDVLPVVPTAENVTIDVTALVEKGDPQSPSFAFVVVFGVD